MPALVSYPGGPGRTRTGLSCLQGRHIATYASEPSSSLVGRGGLEPPHLRIKSPAPFQFGYRPTSTAVVGHRGVEPRPGVYKTPVLTHTPVPNLVSLAATAGLEPAGPSRALLLSGQVLWPLSDVAVHLHGGRPGIRTPTTVSRLGRLATCCLTIRQAFRPFSCCGGGRGIRTPETSRSCPLSRRVPRPTGRPPSYPVAEGEGLEPSDHLRGLLLSGQVPCR